MNNINDKKQIRANTHNTLGVNRNNICLINCCAINANSLIRTKKRYDLQIFIEDNNIDVAMISETRLNDKHKINFPNHHVIRTDRKSTTAAKGGGTALIINKKMDVIYLPQPANLKLKILEFTAAKINTNSKHSLIVVSLYANHTANSPLGEDLQALFEALNMQDDNIAFIMAGDLNARHRSWGDTADNYKGCSLFTWIEKYGIVNKVAHYPPAQATFPRANSFLDHCIIDQRLMIADACNNKVTTTPYDSDHRAITFKVNFSSIARGLAEAQPTPLKPLFKITNWDKFNKYLNNLFKEYQMAPRDKNMTIEQIDEHILLLERCIQQTIEAIVPKAKDYKNGYLIYENHTIKRLHKLKSRLITRVNETKHTTNNNKYNHEYLYLKTTIKLVNYKLQNEYAKSVTAYWQALHRSINHKKQENFFPKINKFLRSKTPIQINNLKIKANDPILSKLDEFEQSDDPNQVYTFVDAATKLEIIGSYFESINSPRHYNDNYNTKAIIDETADRIRNKLQRLRRNNITHIQFSSVIPAHDPGDEEHTVNYHSYIEVTKIARQLRNKTSAGIDNKIPAIVIKNLSTTALIEYTIIFNNAINQHYYPTRWKMAKVLPILKKGKDQSSPTSYRPISLTSNVSKLFEKLIKTNLLRHINNQKIIPDNQFGFKAKHSTIHAIHKFLSDTNTYLNNGKMVGAILLDIEKAFDSVWLNGLIYKLINYNFPEQTTLLVADMVTNKQFVTWDGSQISNKTYTIQEGLQQGTVTSPILFNTYIANIINSFRMNDGNCTHSIAFADDVIIYVADTEPNIIQSKLTNLTNSVNKEYLRWNLKLNPIKSESILFRKTVNEISHKKVLQIKDYHITLHNTEHNPTVVIPNKKIVKYLGVHLDYLLRMNEHHKIQLKKAKESWMINHRIFRNQSMEPRAKVICYMLLIRPVLTYAAPTWWNTGPTIIEKMRKFERACIRTCLNKYRQATTGYRLRISNNDIYDMANITRIDNFILMLTRNYYNSLPAIPNDLIHNLIQLNDHEAIRQTKSGYTTPQLFTVLNNLGLIQNSDNIPVIYHKKRNCANKKISINPDDYLNSKLIYNTSIPHTDKINFEVITKNYWWIDKNQNHIKELIARRTEHLEAMLVNRGHRKTKRKK